jgi:expansin (peptidoglycan-binding protein)
VRRLVLVVVLALGCRAKDATPPGPPPCTAAPTGGSGDATYYEADGTGACSFEAGSDNLVAAMNRADYGSAAWCGACIEVAAGSASVVVRVVDSCPGCKQGDLDLSKEAFARLAPLDKGRIRVAWRSVDCAVDGPIGYRFKDKSNPFWTGIQIRNHRYPITKLEVWDAKGVRREVTRAIYNYFVAQKLGPGPYAMRVTDARGHVHLDPFVRLEPDHTVLGGIQFPRCATN